MSKLKKAQKEDLDERHKTDQHSGIIARIKRNKIPQGTYDIYIHS